jgi:hypothetical protein
LGWRQVKKQLYKDKKIAGEPKGKSIWCSWQKAIMISIALQQI